MCVPSLDRPRKAATGVRARSGGGASAGGAAGVEGEIGARACLRVLRASQLPRDSASMNVDRASLRRETPLAFARADA